MTPGRLIAVSRTLAQGDGPPLTATVELDPTDERSLVRGMAALRAAVREIEGRFDGRCDGCFVEAGRVHLPDCPHAPDDLVELCRREMDDALRAPALPDLH